MTKYQLAYEHLKSSIGKLEPGSLIPSVRDLIADLGVSQITVTRAFKELKHEGLIITRIGEGSFKAGRKSPGDKEVALDALLLLPDYPSTFTGMIQKVFKEHFKRSGHELKIGVYDSLKRPALTRARLKGQGNAVIFMPDATVSPDCIDIALEAGLAAVVIDAVSQSSKTDSVCADNQHGGALVADHFIKQGHRKAAMLLAQPKTFTRDCRQRGFERQFELAGLPAPAIIDCRTESGESSAEKARETTQNLIKDGNFEYSAVFCDSDLGALGLMGACHSSGVAIPGKVEVVGFDNLPESGCFYPSLSSVDQNLALWGIEAERSLVKQLRGEAMESIKSMIPPKLVLRESSSGNIRSAGRQVGG